MTRLRQGVAPVLWWGHIGASRTEKGRVGMILFGYSYSVYTRTVRMVLRMKSVAYRSEEVDPFSDKRAQVVHAFGRVPVLETNGDRIYETQAILDYLEAITPDPPMQPADALARARMRQVMSIADNYFYWPLVRQAVSQLIFHPAMGDPVDQEDLQAGLDAAPKVLDALETIGEEWQALVPGQITLADCHLWPMMDYALMVPQLAQEVAQRPNLDRWAQAMIKHPVAQSTAPDMAALTDG